MDFSIDDGTFTLKNKHKNPGNNILDRGVNYVVPIYQRPYSWTDHQIRKFINDILISFWGNNKDSDTEPMFIGTMQLSIISQDNKQDIIDGQQRISTFLLLLKVLQLKFPELPELKKLNLNWLETKVNNGKQQENLIDLINIESLENPTESKLNKYVQNAKIINHILSENIQQESEDSTVFNPSEFINHLYSNIYFVVIETNAGLSKTLQIFDAINTTGLDLNAGDVFKIRMFEYLNKDGNNDSIFNEISKLGNYIHCATKI